MSIYRFFKHSKRIVKIYLILAIFIFCFDNLCAQHLFSVSYNNLSQEDAQRIRTQVASPDVSITSLARGARNEYDISLSTVRDTRIIILNEETGNNVVITPTEDAPTQFRLQPFFIEELRRSVLGNADRLLMIEAEADFSVRNAASVSRMSEDVFIPRYFYGPKENVREALPKDRQIIHIFKERPRLIPAFPDDPENLRLLAQIEEEMSYYVYMYKLPDGTLIIFDEHFINPNTEQNEIRTNNTTTNISTNLQFLLSDNFNSFPNPQDIRETTRHAYGLWSEQLAGTVPVNINVLLTDMNHLGLGILGGSYNQPHYWNPATQMWYSSALGNQLAGYKVSNLSDIRIEMNSNLNWGIFGNFSWNFLITSSPSSSQFDWLTVMLHEITHGLGFAPLVWMDGTYRYTTSGGTAGIITNSPGIFDYQLYEGNTSNVNLTDPTLTPSRRAAIVTSQNLFSGRPGSYLLAANGGARVRMHAPSRWENGSSVSHWHVSGTPILMRHEVNRGFRHAAIDAREVAMMLDMGWNLGSNCNTTLNNQTYNSGTHTITGGCCDLTISNTTIGSNATVNIRGQEAVILKPGFHAQAGSQVTITAGIFLDCIGPITVDFWPSIVCRGGNLSLFVNNATHYSVEVFNTWGLRVHTGSGSIVSSPATVWTPSVTSGTYYVNITFSSPFFQLSHSFDVTMVSCPNNAPIMLEIDNEDMPAQTDDPCPFPISYIYHPNPTDGELTIEFGELNPNFLQNNPTSTTHSFDIRLFDRDGRQVRRTSWNSNHPSRKVHFDLRNLPTGTYYLHLETAGQVKKEQIIVQ